MVDDRLLRRAEIETFCAFLEGRKETP